jgi:hypothetical protein
VLYILQDHLGTGTCDRDHPVLAGAKNTDRSGILLRLDGDNGWHGFGESVRLCVNP